MKNGYATLGEIAQDICIKKGLELETSSFLNSDKKVAVYDNQLKAREYMSYIAEKSGGFCCASRDGKIQFRQLGQDTLEIPLKLFKTYKFGEEYKISRVAYEDGARSFKFGDETRNTLWIRQDNLFVADEAGIEKIYNQLNGLTINSFEGMTIIDPRVDIGDKIIIDNKAIIYQGEMTLNKRFIADIKSKISIKQKQETTIKKEGQKVINRRVQSEINQIDGKIKTLVEEVGDRTEKSTSITQDIDSISQKVSNIEDLTNTTEGNKTINLGNCIEGDLLELHIYGNNNVFEYLYPGDTLYPSDTLYPKGDSRIVVTDKDRNQTTYELGVLDVLRQNGDICDEYVLEKEKAKVIRRIAKDGSILANETTEDLGDFSIKLSEGTNTIAIQNYTAKIKAKFAIKSNYTDVFATRVEMNSSITQTAEEINLEVSKKVDENEVISKINQSAETVGISANKIELSANDVLNLLSGNTINLSGKQIKISSNNFNVDENGNMSCNNANIKGNITSSNISGSTIRVSGDPEHPAFIADNGDEWRTYIYPLGLLHEYDMYSSYVAIQKGGIGMGTFTSTSMSETVSMDKDGIRTPSLTQTSLEESKKNFEKLNNGLDIIKNTDIYKYNLKSQKDTDKKHIGFVIGKDYKYSKEITALDNEGKEVGADTYSMISVAYKAIQEQQEVIEQLQTKIKELEEKQNG